MKGVMKEAESKYIGYHSHIKSMRPTSIPESERVSLDQNIAMFIANCASEVHEFGTHIEQAYGDHHREIVKSLIEVSGTECFFFLFSSYLYFRIVSLD